MITVALEYRPALFQAFGIGRYVKNLAEALLDADPGIELKLFSAFLRGHDERARGHDWPKERVHKVGVHWPGRLVPVLGRLGYTFDHRLAPFDLFHHTDYAITPLKTPRRVVTLYDTAWLPSRGFVEPKQAARMEGAVRALLRGDPEVIALSEFARLDLIDYFRLDPQRVHVTPLAADPVFARPRAAAALDEVLSNHGVRRPFIVSLGTLEPRKNIVGLIRAMKIAREKHADLSLVQLGRKGFGHDAIVAEGAALGDAFRWLGSVPDEDAAALVQASAALAFPSLFEGFGLPAIEGMAAGVPVIASDIPVMREICGDAARLVDTTRPEVLADALSWAVADRGAAALAAAGKKRAEEFTWRRCAEGTLRAYRRALALA